MSNGGPFAPFGSPRSTGTEARFERCEFDPVVGRAARNDKSGCQNEATVGVGANGKWHLCQTCADLPLFRRAKKKTLRKRKS